MTHNIHTLILWIRIDLVIAAIGTTAVPVIYAFAPWRKRLLGKIFMMKAISFAAAMDLTVLFIFWQPRNILIQFWTEAIVMAAIAVSTSLQAFMIWRLRRHQLTKEDRYARPKQ